jgi:hypothetical protein
LRVRDREGGPGGRGPDALGLEPVRAQRRASAMQWLLRERLKMPDGVIEYAAPWIFDPATRSDRGTGGAGGRDVGARTFDALCHSAVCRRARPTAVEPHGVSAIVERLWAEYGRFASRDLSEFA